MTKPLVAMTMGDPAGIGPEICLLAALDPAVKNTVNTVIIGDLKRLTEAQAVLDEKGRWPKGSPEMQGVSDIKAIDFTKDAIYVYDLANVPDGLPWGEISRTAGQCAFEYVEESVKLAVNHTIDAICTAPINKEAWKLAGVPYPGHTEALASLSGSKRFAMMLINAGLRVVHVTTHVSLKRAIELAKPERILEVIELTAESLRQFGIKDPRIAVAGLNPHAGEGGLFGNEDEEQIRPAVETAKAHGITTTGPLPPDSVYGRAAGGEFDAVIAMYHDQGHIAIKMLGMDTGINCTIGLPILRTSVDHGTAFDIAGKGIARETSMVAAMEVAADFLKHKG